MTIQDKLRMLATTGEVSSVLLLPAERSTLREAADRLDELEGELRDRDSIAVIEQLENRIRRLLNETEVEVVRYEVNDNGFPEVVPLDADKPTGTKTVYEITMPKTAAEQ